jgi:hypothetical protein
MKLSLEVTEVVYELLKKVVVYVSLRFVLESIGWDHDWGQRGQLNQNITVILILLIASL